MATSEWPDLLKRITLKHPIPTDIRADPDPDRSNGWMIKVTLHVACVLTGEPITVNTRLPLPPLADVFGRETYAINLIKTAIRHAWLHELTEGFWIDGAHWENPHATGGQHVQAIV